MNITIKGDKIMEKKCDNACGKMVYTGSDSELRDQLSVLLSIADIQYIEVNNDVIRVYKETKDYIAM